MVWRTAVRGGLLISIGYAGWIAGSLSERNKILNENVEYTDQFGSVLRKLPGLPIFATVSATSLPDRSDKLIPFPDEEPLVSSKPKVVNRISQIMRFGFPGLDNVRSLDDYVLSYDRRNRVAHWVFEHLTEQTVKRIEGVDRSQCQFTEDKSIHPYFRSLNSDYRGSGYDRGHLAAAGNHRTDQKHIEQTFLLSNMAPQVGEGFNRSSWNKLEKHVRKLTRKYCNVYVCTGPLYLPRKEADGKTYVKYEVIGANSVAVPTHFFKVIVGEKNDQTLEMEAYVMPNQPISDDTPLNVFQVPPESIERAAGLLFFDRISRDKLRCINGRKTTFV
ncbi:endonuclease G, mitochondrial [Anabrus simplex]|uniref:endonuclease G, mitochondrial n=1 Tax=Anabrus simplex TaxID=316456 RepID=UPI0035A29BDF